MAAVLEEPRLPTRDELREEFRNAQRRRLLNRAVVCWRDTESPDLGPIASVSPPPDEADST